jgi:hypothetical protein
VSAISICLTRFRLPFSAPQLVAVCRTIVPSLTRLHAKQQGDDFAKSSNFLFR